MKVSGPALRNTTTVSFSISMVFLDHKFLTQNNRNKLVHKITNSFLNNVSKRNESQCKNILLIIVLTLFEKDIGMVLLMDCTSL